MSGRVVVTFVSILCVGLLAGVEFVVHYVVRPSGDVLDDRSQLQLRQSLIMKLRVLVPALFLPAALSGIAATVLGDGGPYSWLRYVALLALLIWVFIRVIGTVPINSQTIEWQPEAPPQNWKSLVDHAERFHIVGTWASVVAFVGFLIPALTR